MSDLITSNRKTFFEKKEGKVGLAFIGVLGFAAFILFGNVILPFVISALTNTLHAIFLGGSVLGIISLAMNNKFRMLVSSVFQSCMRKLTGLFIPVDPIGILENYIRIIEKKLKIIETNVGNLYGQIQNIANNILLSTKDRDNNLRIASAAKSQNKMEEHYLYNRKAARDNELVIDFTKTFDQLKIIETKLNRMKKSSYILLEDTKHDVKSKKVRYKSIKAAHKVAQQSSELINGGTSEKELFEQALEFMAEDISMKIGEINHFMDISENFMSGVDIKNGIWDEQGISLFESWEKESKILSYTEGKKELNSPETNINNIKLIKETNYNHLFKENS